MSKIVNTPYSKTFKDDIPYLKFSEATDLIHDLRPYGVQYYKEYELPRKLYTQVKLVDRYMEGTAKQYKTSLKQLGLNDEKLTTMLMDCYTRMPEYKPVEKAQTYTYNYLYNSFRKQGIPEQICSDLAGTMYHQKVLQDFPYLFSKDHVVGAHHLGTLSYKASDSFSNYLDELNRTTEEEKVGMALYLISTNKADMAEALLEHVSPASYEDFKSYLEYYSEAQQQVLESVDKKNCARMNPFLAYSESRVKTEEVER